jgi:hypothetical protein
VASQTSEVGHGGIENRRKSIRPVINLSLVERQGVAPATGGATPQQG